MPHLLSRILLPRLRLPVLLATAGVFLSAHPAAAKKTESQRPGPPCVAIAQVLPSSSQTDPQPTQPQNQEVCIQAHIYDLAELNDGTRFLDVCPPATSDDDCRFLLISLREDRDDVGDLRRYSGQDVQIRGLIRQYRGRFGIRISHARQFDGGPEKFRPNPKLLSDFNAQSDREPIRDPALRSTGHHRNFMDRTEREELPQKKP